MEYLKTYYSLEKHLEETVKYNPQFEILNAIWKLNKKNLSSALSNVNQYFPHYSLHDRSHSNTIINNIELFLGEERIKRLSPTNTWLLLMASFTHDLGMVVFQELIEKEWSSNAFQQFLLSLSDWDDEDMRESGKLLINLQNLSANGKQWDSLISPIRIKNSVTLVVAEYMRRIHHQRSSDILKGIDKTFHEVANEFYSDQIPNRLLSLLGDVAFLHGVEFYEIFKKLDYESNGISNDKINPRFIATMLRLGDLLDIDDGRFNVFTINVFNLPESSHLHKKKHSSIKHFLITPEAIEITADCPEEQIYRLARSWFDWLELEVENLNKEWTNIAPEDLTGSAPRIPKDKIRVFFNGSSANENLLNLRFKVSNEKIFEILEGGSIYEKAEFTFIRELVQNALDASKIQLWTEIERGTYDFVFRKEYGDDSLTHQEIIEKIRFPTDIPLALQNSFHLSLNIKWESEKKENLIIEVSDTGTGISDSDLIRMTTKVGESRKGNKTFSELVKRMPFWLKPTGAFGIGLQTLFIIVDSFEVYTKADGEDGKIILFRSSKKGKYSTVRNDFNINQRGTKVKVIIPEFKFPEVFGSTFGWDIIAKYDPFTDEFGSIYVHKIKEYITTILFKINNLKINFFNKELPESKKNIDSVFEKIGGELKNEHAICNIFFNGNNLYFDYYENIIGSQITLKYFAQDLLINDDYWPAYQAEFFVRDIPVNSKLISYNVLSYCKLSWNFMSESSDKILSITREKFLSKRMREVESKFQAEVLPKILPLIVNFFANNENEKKLESLYHDNLKELSLVYFKIALTLKVNQIDNLNLNQKWLNESLDNFILEKGDGTKVKMIDFFDADKVIVPTAYKHDYISNGLLFKKEVIQNWQDIPSDKIIIWRSSLFKAYLRLNYYISEIRYYKEGFILTLIKGKQNEANIEIKEGYEFYLNGFDRGKSIAERALNYSESKYFENLSVVNEYNSGFENFPNLSSTSVISPFKNFQQIKDLIEKFSWTIDTKKETIFTALTDDILKIYITSTLIDWVIEHNPVSNKKRNPQDVIENYRLLIAEIIFNKIANTIQS